MPESSLADELIELFIALIQEGSFTQGVIFALFMGFLIWLLGVRLVGGALNNIQTFFATPEEGDSPARTFMGCVTGGLTILVVIGAIIIFIIFITTNESPLP